MHRSRDPEHGGTLLVALVALTALFTVGSITLLSSRSELASVGQSRASQETLYAAESGVNAAMEWLRGQCGAGGQSYFSALASPGNLTPVKPAGIVGNGQRPGQPGFPFPPGTSVWYEVWLLNNTADPGFAGGIVSVDLDITGDCVAAACPASAPYPVGCDISMIPPPAGDPDGCVAVNARGVYFQSGDFCGVGWVKGKLMCSSTKGAALSKTNCPIKGKKNWIYGTKPQECPPPGANNKPSDAPPGWPNWPGVNTGGGVTGSGTDADGILTLRVVGHGPEGLTTTIEVAISTSVCPMTATTPFNVFSWRQL